MIRRLLAPLLFGLTVLSFGLSGSTSSGMVPVVVGIDCKAAPTPAMPGQGLAGFFGAAPDPLPPTADPFELGSETTIYQQYGFAGLRWHTYDLGCGPDAARAPGAIIGTTVANWIMNLPIALAALTASLTEVAFKPTFLSVFDPLIREVSTKLHDSLFQGWVPVVLAAIGLFVLIQAGRAALATSTAAVGWALLVILVATMLVRGRSWPATSPTTR